MYTLGRKSRPSDEKIFAATVPLEPVDLIATSVSYEYLEPIRLNQNSWGSCTAHGTIEWIMSLYNKHFKQVVLMSTRAQYCQTKRAYESNDVQDDGAMVIDALQVLKNYGYVLASDWPYPANGDVTAMFQPVPDNLWHKDLLVKTIVNVPVDVQSMKIALYKHGPLVIGMNWANAYFTPGADGTLPTPDSSAGGHCVLIVAYDDAKGHFKIRNSWGAEWGLNGDCYLPYSYATDHVEFFPDECYSLTV